MGARVRLLPLLAQLSDRLICAHTVIVVVSRVLGAVSVPDGAAWGPSECLFFDVRSLSCFQSCKVHTDAMITCPSPAASNTTVGSKPAPVDFYLNGRRYTDARLAPDEELYPEEALHLSKFSMEYYADPQFSTAKKEKWIKHHPGEPLTLVIHVREWHSDWTQVREGDGGSCRGDAGAGSSCSAAAPAPGDAGLGCPLSHHSRATFEGCNSKKLNKILNV